jgi:Uma2 family endonuclease
MSTTTTADLPRMTADKFIAWAMEQLRGEKYELSDGRIIAKSPERYGHAALTSEIGRLQGNAIKEAGLPCRGLVDGLAVRVDADTVFEPDILVRCGPPPAASTVDIDDPIIVVEVLSPSTSARDRTTKLAGYFRLPSVQHDLLVSGDEQRIVHHRRMTDIEFTTTIFGNDPIRLDPPGLVLSGVFD